MPENISLTEFCAGMRRRLAEFERQWKLRDGNPNYPQQMEIGDWEEQLLCYDFDEHE